MLRYKTETRPDLVALYDIRPVNGAGQFLQPRSPHGVLWYGHVIRKVDGDWVKNMLLWRLREPDKEIGKGKTWKKVVYRDMNDLRIKLSDRRK